METDRRGFFRIVGAGFALLAAADPRESGERTVREIQRATRNTRLGAWGIRLPRLGPPPPPFKPYPGVPRIALDPVESTPGLGLGETARDYRVASGFQRQPLSLPQLGRLLYFTNGVTGRWQGEWRELLLRAAPSAGALYAGEVYVIAERVRGLPSGLYYYGVKRHELMRLRSGPLLAEVMRAVERPGTLEDAPAVVLLTNVFERYTRRYANRGYRYALIDTGHIGENLRLGAASAGLGDVSPLRFQDDLLNELLGVDGREEAVCAVHALGLPSGPGALPAPVVRRLAEGGRARGLRGEIERYHQVTKLIPAQRSEDASTPPGPVAPAGAGISLPAPGAAGGIAVEEAIRRRRSAATFEKAWLELDALSAVLATVQGNPALVRKTGVDLLVVAHRVKGLDPGLYRYQGRGHRLVALREGDLSRAMVRACLGQEKAGTAALGFLMVGRLREAAAAGGGRSYRDLLLESGAIGQRIYLAAEAQGLAARNLAAFVDDDLNELMGLDGFREAAIHLTMFGPGQ
jgi:SagB-type dehydrogenase family enzyme